MNPNCRKAIEQALAHGFGLELASPRRNSGLNGRRTGRGSGNALEFAEYREYRAGDDLRRLDWNVYARSEQLMIKLFSEEVDPRCDLICDHSASMSAGSESKSAAALGLTALLAQAASNAGFSLAVWHCADVLEKEPCPEHPLEWRCDRFDAPESPGEILGGFTGRFQARGIRIAVSDLLWAGDPGRFLRRLGDGAMRCVLIELLSRADLEPEGGGNVLVVDAESGEERELFFDTALLARYRERLARHREMWARAAEQYGVQLIRLEADALLAEWDLRELFRCGVLKW